jgi:hypothetical protein
MTHVQVPHLYKEENGLKIVGRSKCSIYCPFAELSLTIKT